MFPASAPEKGAPRAATVLRRRSFPRTAVTVAQAAAFTVAPLASGGQRLLGKASGGQRLLGKASGVP